MNNIERQLQLSLNKIAKLSTPQSVLDTNFKILRALRLLFLSILIWGRKVSLLSKRRPKNLVLENGFKFSSSKTLGMHFCNK
jgi:hypothetical protein